MRLIQLGLYEQQGARSAARAFGAIAHPRLAMEATASRIPRVGTRIPRPTPRGIARPGKENAGTNVVDEERTVAAAPEKIVAAAPGNALLARCTWRSF